MNEFPRTCIKGVGTPLKCPSCNSLSIKYGKSRSGKQRYYCKGCKSYFLEYYTRQSYRIRTNQKIVKLLKEGSGISNISRYLEIAKVTVIRRILKIAGKLNRPPILFNQTYGIDELWTYIKSKAHPVWLIYALCRESKEVIGFSVGSRTNPNIGSVVNPIVLSNPIKIYTDKFQSYKVLIPEHMHSTKFRGTNHIERKNLSLRTHLKRLNRRTICFSKSVVVLSACLRIYFWG